MLIKFMVIMKQILVFRRFHNIAKSDYQLRRVCLSVRPSVRAEQIESHWKDFCEILYLRIPRNYV